MKISGYNSRLDTFQAVVGNWLLPQAKKIANTRIKNAIIMMNTYPKYSDYDSTKNKIIK